MKVCVTIWQHDWFVDKVHFESAGYFEFCHVSIIAGAFPAIGYRIETISRIHRTRCHLPMMQRSGNKSREGIKIWSFEMAKDLGIVKIFYRFFFFRYFSQLLYIKTFYIYNFFNWYNFNFFFLQYKCKLEIEEYSVYHYLFSRYVEIYDFCIYFIFIFFIDSHLFIHRGNDSK